MKLLYEFGVIMAVTFLGEICHAVLPLPIDPVKSPPEGLIKISLFRHSLLFFFPVPPPVNTG